MIQPIITSIASRIAEKKVSNAVRPVASMRVRAKAKINANRISDRKPPLAAAAMTLLGTMPARNSPSGGTAPGGPTFTSAPRKAAAEAAGIGTRPRNSGVSSAAATALLTITTRMMLIARAATAPLRAASAVDAMPVTKSEKTSGITVICSALSQAEPIGCATAVAPGTAAGSQVAKAMPRSNPAPSDTRIRVDGLFNVADILALIRKRRYQAPLKIRA